METMILLDTHVVVWLFAGLTDRLSAKARRLIEESGVGVSPAVELELAHLHEIGRVRESPPAIIGDLASRIGLRVAQIQFSHLCTEAIPMSWTRDPFDRLQSAHAQAKNLPLVTKDSVILENLALAVWD